jgi:hypothetical protein
VDIAHGRVIEVLSPNKGREIVEKPLAGGNVAGTRPRLDERCAFPVLPAALVIGERRIGRDRDLSRGRVGTQAQIDTEDVAILRALLQELHEVARQPDVKQRRFDIRRERCARWIKKDHKIDVA